MAGARCRWLDPLKRRHSGAWVRPLLQASATAFVAQPPFWSKALREKLAWLRAGAPRLHQQQLHTVLHAASPRPGGASPCRPLSRPPQRSVRPPSWSRAPSNSSADVEHLTIDLHAPCCKTISTARFPPAALHSATPVVADGRTRAEEILPRASTHPQQAAGKDGLVQ